MDKQAFNDEMVAIVRSEEAKKVLEQGLKNLDPKALTPDGIIKSYEVDYDSIQHNTMGGIIFDVITNQDKKLMINTTLSKDSETNNLKIQKNT